MGRVYTDIAFVTAAGKLLRDVTSIEVTTNYENAEPVFTMNPDRRALGYKRGARKIEVTIDSRVGTPREIDWRALEASGEQILLTYQENESGKIFHVVDLLVTEVATTHAQDGESTDRISASALDHFERPS